MKKNSPSDGILVFDRYYSKKPSAVVLAVMRVLFCAAFSASAMLFVFSQYSFSSISLGYVGIITALCTAVLSVLFIFVKRRFAIPALCIVALLILHHHREVLWEYLSYFTDEFMLLFDGRFLHPRQLLLHKESLLTKYNSIYRQGMLLGTFMMCFGYSFLCSATMNRRIRILPATVVLALLCAPRLISENFEFRLWLIPIALLITAGLAISVNYSNGLAIITRGNSAYRQQVKDEDIQFRKNASKASVRKRVAMYICCYSKYASSGFYCAAVFALALCVGINLFNEGTGIDYTPLFEMVENIGDDEVDGTVVEDAVSEYFSSPDDESDSLSITSPGRSNKRVLKVTFTGDKPIYLRGDIGIDFAGDSWITPVNDDSKWRNKDFSEYYRPAELKVLSLLLDEINDIPDSPTVTVSTESEISIEYLCETDVVFLPAYTGDFSYYDNEYFDVYGDYCVRVSDAADNYVNSVQCTAVLNDFGEDPVATINAAYEAMDMCGLYTNDLYSVIVPALGYGNDIIDEYTDYVMNTYLSVPDDMRAQLDDFLYTSGLNSTIVEFMDTDNTSVFRYQTAAAIDEYLNNNYTYSLSNTNRGDGAVIEFLTQTKRGHCSLYASSMTLLLRELGIPARYCTGFAVHPQSVTGNTKVLKERDLHAWVEVYIDNFGWVTFDPTSAAVNGQQGGDESTAESTTATTATTSSRTTRPTTQTEPTTDPVETEEPADTTESDETTSSSEVVETDETNEASPSQPKFEIPKELIAAIISVLLLALLVVFVVWHCQSVRKRAEALLSRLDRNTDKTIYNCIIDILYFSGFTPMQGELPKAFYARADKGLNAGLSASIQVLEAVAFGRAESDDNDRDALKAVLTRVFRSVEKHSNVIRRYKLRKAVIRRLSRK